MQVLYWYVQAFLYPEVKLCRGTHIVKCVAAKLSKYK